MVKIVQMVICLGLLLSNTFSQSSNLARLRPTSAVGFTNHAKAVDGLTNTEATAAKPNNNSFILITLPYEATISNVQIQFNAILPSNVVVYGAPAGSTNYVRLGKAPYTSSITYIMTTAGYYDKIKVVINDDGAGSSTGTVSIKEIEITGKTKTAYQLNYDAAGNRVETKIISLLTPKSGIAGNNADSLNYILPPDNEKITEQFGNSNINIYPNPVKQALIIELTDVGNEMPATAEVYDLVGKRIKNCRLGTGLTQIDFGLLPDAMYIVKLHCNGTTNEWKIVKK